MKKIAIASDHGGFDLKKSVIAQLLKEGWEIDDLGPSNEDSVDYPDYGIKLAEAIANKKVERGIVICGTGVGMSIVVNRFPGIRGTLCSDVFTAKMCREHNDSNILIGNIKLDKDFIYDNQKNKFELKKYEKIIQENLIDKILQEINIRLHTL